MKKTYKNPTIVCAVFSESDIITTSITGFSLFGVDGVGDGNADKIVLGSEHIAE